MILKAHLLNSDLFFLYWKTEEKKKNWDECNEEVSPVHTEQMRLNVQKASVLHVSSLPGLRQRLLSCCSGVMDCVVLTGLCVVYTVSLEWQQGTNQLYFGSLYLQYCHNAKQSHNLFIGHEAIPNKSVVTPQAPSQNISISSPLTHSMFSPAPSTSTEVNVMALHPKIVKISSASTHTGQPVVLSCITGSGFDLIDEVLVMCRWQNVLWFPPLVHKSTQPAVIFWKNSTII